MSTYIYYFREKPDKLNHLEGYIRRRTYREAVWHCQLQCVVRGYVVFGRPLSQKELEQYDLIPDPRNNLAGVMIG